MFTLFLEGLEFYAHHGVEDAERQVGHRYVVDLEVDVEGKAAKTDKLADTVDYTSVAQLVVTHGQADPCRTMERLAGSIAEALLETHPRIVEVRLRLAKRLPPAPIIAEAAGVEIVRSR